MKEQLISFETAKLAKEKGFDIPCLYAYRIWRENIKKTDKNPLQGLNIEYEPYMGGSSASIKFYYQSKQYTLAPTQSLLQKWLREKHNIIVQARYEHILMTSADITPKLEIFKIDNNCPIL